MIVVEVAYVAADGRAALVAVALPDGATLEAAVRASGVLSAFPEIDLARCGAGVFGKAAALDAPLRDGDRVEIYRPLLADPKAARRRRAERSRTDGR